jgi:putative FmdB family regulatory protein
MPVYDYECTTHGAFEALRPMSESAAAQPCPHCGASSVRVILSFAQLAVLSTAARHAHGLNESSAHQPKTSAQLRHGPACGCCGGAKQRPAATAGRPMRGFAGQRPWMISH